MKFKVHLTAFTEGQIRVVEVPDDKSTGDTNEVLESIYRYGQNEVVPMKDRCSLSAGDAIEYKKKLYLILMAGFVKYLKYN